MQRLKHHDWALRLIAFAVVLIVELVAATFYIIPAALSFVEGRIPGVSFYHLAPGEAPGPLGDVSEALWSIGLETALFLAFVVPVVFYMRIQWFFVVAATLSYFPVQLLLMKSVQALSR